MSSRSESSAACTCSNPGVLGHETSCPVYAAIIAGPASPPRPEVESLEDLWCWLNIWGDLLYKHQARTRPDRLSTEWRKGYERAISDAMEKLEHTGVSWGQTRCGQPFRPLHFPHVSSGGLAPLRETDDITPVPSAASTAHDAADAILYDLSGRAGFDAWWEDIAPDVKDDIRDAMAELIEAVHVR